LKNFVEGLVKSRTSCITHATLRAAWRQVIQELFRRDRPPTGAYKNVIVRTGENVSIFANCYKCFSSKK
jgi:hypothetical protein